MSAQIWLVMRRYVGWDAGEEPVAGFSSEQRAQAFTDDRNRRTMGNLFGDPNVTPDYSVRSIDFDPEP